MIAFGGSPETHELIAELTSIRDRATRTSDAARRAVALLPVDARGTDPSGAVAVVLDADGLPVSVRVSPDWTDRLTPADFAGAVTAACRAAESARMTRWGDRLAELNRTAAFPSRPADELPTLDTYARHPHVEPDSSAEGMEALRRRLHTSLRAAPASEPPDTELTGRAAGGMLAVTIARAGVQNCSASPGWVARQSAARLATAVSEAFHDAREQRPAARRGDERHRSDGAVELGRIAHDAIAVLHALTGAATSARRPDTTHRTDDAP